MKLLVILFLIKLYARKNIFKKYYQTAKTVFQFFQPGRSNKVPISGFFSPFFKKGDFSSISFFQPCQPPCHFDMPNNQCDVE